ncbi:MAG: glycosyltransferase family 4 protein [Ignavibacteriales bacterium]|nr:glycosyltransferase family 4 protein [Ignavibacteriales bacterium]
MFKSSENKTVVINATNIGRKLSGIGVYTLNLLRNFSEQDDKTNFIVYANQSAKDHVSKINFPTNFSIIWVTSLMSPDNHFKGHLLRFAFSNILSFLHKDAIVFNTSQLEVSLFNKNQVVTIHDIIPLLFKQYHFKQYFFFKYFVKIALKKCRLIVTPSNHSKSLIKHTYSISDEKIIVIANGTKENKSGNMINTKSGEGKYILYYGRITPMKNIAGVINSFSLIKHQIKHKLVLAGDDAKEIVKLIKNGVIKEYDAFCDRIIYAGHLSDIELSSLIRNASLLLFPSFYEGFGLPPLEAMSLGCPVVVSNNSSLPEICGNAAYYVEPNDNMNIATGILEVLSNSLLRENLIKTGYQRAGLFSWKETALLHLKMLNEIHQQNAVTGEKYKRKMFPPSLLDSRLDYQSVKTIR